MQEHPELYIQIKTLTLVAAGLLIIIGFRRQGLKLFLSAIVMAVSFPLLLGVIDEMPLWVSVAILFIAGIIMFKRVVGKEAWGQFFGSILYDIFWRLPISIIRGLWKSISKVFIKKREGQNTLPER